jgi:hypothetical protein
MFTPRDDSADTFDQTSFDGDGSIEHAVGSFDRRQLGFSPVHSTHRLRYAGKVGTGFTAAALTALGPRLAALEQTHSPFVDARTCQARRGRQSRPP